MTIHCEFIINQLQIRHAPAFNNDITLFNCNHIWNHIFKHFKNLPLFCVAFIGKVVQTHFLKLKNDKKNKIIRKSLPNEVNVCLKCVFVSSVYYKKKTDRDVNVFWFRKWTTKIHYEIFYKFSFLVFGETECLQKKKLTEYFIDDNYLPQKQNTQTKTKYLLRNHSKPSHSVVIAHCINLINICSCVLSQLNEFLNNLASIQWHVNDVIHNIYSEKIRICYL